MKKLVGEGKPFHSAVDKAAGMLKRKVGTGAEFMKELMGVSGVKPTELQERGLTEIMGMPRMTHDQFMANLATRPAPKIREKVLGGDRSESDSEAPYHEKWTLPGGKNYREMLIKAPETKFSFDAPPQFGGDPNHFGGEPGILASMRLKDRIVPGDMGYTLVNKKSGNKSQRYNTTEEAMSAWRNMPESIRPMLSIEYMRGPDKKLLHLEELQSDWHQQGRDKGYKSNAPEEEVRKAYNAQGYNAVPFDELRPEDRAHEIKKFRERGVPDAPFKKNWEEMALKRLIHHAAEKGYHGVVITPGKEQAERYNIGDRIETVSYHPEIKQFRAVGKNGETVLHENNAEKDRIKNLIGEDAAKNLLSSNVDRHGFHTLSGLDLRTSDKGMKGFYDTKVPNILNSIGKKYGVKTELHGHPIEKEPANRLQVGEMTYEDPAKIAQLHHFPITEEMRKDVLTNGLPLYNKGGTVHMADGGDMDQMQLAIMNKQLGMYKAADRAKAGRMAAEAIKKEPEIKASEALGQLREKGFKRTTTTQSDRTRVGGGNIGGAAFPAISNVDPEYKGKPWGVMDTNTASRLTNLTNPETAWTTMLGSEHQLKSNPIVFDKLRRQFQTAMKQGLLPSELEAKINHNLALTFGEGASIRDPKIWKMADTFEKRRALAELMMGQGIPPAKGGVALGGEKSGNGVIFQPTKTLIQETEPSLFHPEHGGDIPTFAAGPRLFQLEKEASYRPDLHPGFPTLIHGKDLNMRMKPVPTESYLPDWHKAFKEANPHRKKPGYYDLALGMEGQGLPSQELTDAYLRHLIMEGFKRGGPVRMADGGQVDIQNIGVEEAPDMDVKQYFMPRPMTSNVFPVGGIQQAPQAPGQPQQPPMQPNQPQPGQQLQQQQPSNILQMTRQGQAMSAMTPPKPMARGGHVDRDTMMFELMNRKTKVKHG